MTDWYSAIRNAILLLAALPLLGQAPPTKADLLIVGGNESAVAAAIQAARLGVAKIALVNDIQWLGGQFSAEGVGAVDEWTLYRGRRVNFPRSGIFLEILREIRAHNARLHGHVSPGNAFTATDTIEPAAAAKIFDQFVARYAKQITVYRGYTPTTVHLSQGAVRGVTFTNGQRSLRIDAPQTIDASDWGDVIRLSGARYAAGPDPKSRFQEPGAPDTLDDSNRHEMNPITYCLVLQQATTPKLIPPPPGYDERSFLGAVPATIPQFEALRWPGKPYVSRMPLFVDTDYPEGTYSGNASVYTHRRLLDAKHGYSKLGRDKVLLNFPINDYPIYNYPASLEKALGASAKKNLVDMSPAERALVFADAKLHSLRYFHHLQKHSPQFAALELSDEFGTPDRLPWKPYIREGLRLEALYMIKEQDIKEQKAGDLGWARFMPEDNVFGFQFNIDFHPTRRVFLAGKDGPWMVEHTEARNWSTHTDRGGFPLRSLIPVERDGLLGAGKNLGVSSLVSSAIRLHGQTMHAGQAAATLAALALREKTEPRRLAAQPKFVEEIQLTLVRGLDGGPGILLWPYHDLDVDARHFEAANMLAVKGILPGLENSLDFEAWRPVTRGDIYLAFQRARLPFTAGRGEAKAPATWRDLYDALQFAQLPASAGLAKVDYRLKDPSPPLYRFELALHLWHALRAR